MSSEDIRNNRHYFILIIVYGCILSIIYSYWMAAEGLPVWSYILVALGFILAGVLCAFLSTIYESHKKQKEINEVKDNEKIVEPIENTQDILEESNSKEVKE